MKIAKIFAGMSAMALAASMLTVVSASADDAKIGEIGLYAQNQGGDWAWYTVGGEDGMVDVTAPGQYTISQDFDQSAFSAYTPVEEWESIPALGIQVVNSGITAVGDKGKVASKVSDFTVTYDGGKTVTLDEFECSGDQLGKKESWGLAGTNVSVNVTDQIKSKLDLDDEGYIAFIGTIENISATVDVEDISTVREELGFQAVLGFASMDWSVQSWDQAVDVCKGENTLTVDLGAKTPDVGVFVIDFKDAYPNFDWNKVEVTGLEFDGEPVEFNAEGVTYGNLEEDTDNYRINIFNQYFKDDDGNIIAAIDSANSFQTVTIKFTVDATPVATGDSSSADDSDSKSETVTLKHVEKKAATATEDGNIEYWYDEANDKYYSDAEGKNEIKKADTVIAKTGESKADSSSTSSAATSSAKSSTSTTSNPNTGAAALAAVGVALAGAAVVASKKRG